MQIDQILYDELMGTNKEYQLGVTRDALRLLAGGLLPNVTGTAQARHANTSFYGYESWGKVVMEGNDGALLAHLKGSLHTITFARHARKVRMCGLSYYMAHMRRAATLLADQGMDQGFWDVAALTPNICFLAMILVPSSKPALDYWLASELPAREPGLRYAFEHLYSLAPHSHATMVANESMLLS